MNNKRKYTDALGVAPSASEPEIKAAYRKMARKYHPDKNRDPGAAEQFRKIQEAYEVITGKTEEAALDPVVVPRRNGASTAEFFNYSAGLKEQFKNHYGAYFSTTAGFGPSFKRRRTAAERKVPVKPPVVYHDMMLSLEQLARGCEKKLSVDYTTVSTAGRRCKSKNIVSVCIKPGQRTGVTRTFPEMGSQKEAGGPRGDLAIRLHQRVHPYFVRDKDHLVFSVKMVKPVIGEYVLDVDDVFGERITKKIRGPIARGAIQRILGRGMPSVSGLFRGDLIIKFI